MKKLILILIITFNFQSYAKADDIRDFEIEGISIGDNLVNYMSKKNIIANIQGHYSSDSKFFEVEYTGNKNQYEHLLFHVKRKDKNYKIYYIRAVNIVRNKNECNKIKKNIVKELRNSFLKTKFLEGNQKHYFYQNSTQYISQFNFTNNKNANDHIRVECMIFAEEDKKIHGNLPSTLEVIIGTKEFGIWLNNQ